MREPPAADAESADRFHRDFPDFPDAGALRLDDTSRTVDTATLPERQPGCASHRRVCIGTLHDIPPEPESEHVVTLHDYAQSQRVAGKNHLCDEDLFVEKEKKERKADRSIMTNRITLTVIKSVRFNKILIGNWEKLVLHPF